MMRYALVVGDRGHQRKDPLSLVVPSRTYAIEHVRCEEDVERRSRSVVNKGGRVIAVGFEEDAGFMKHARLAVVQLTTGNWSIEKARQYLLRYLEDSCRDSRILQMNQQST